MMRKKWITLLLCAVFVLTMAVNAMATPQAASPVEFEVAIASPTGAEGLPVYNADFEIVITNLTDHELTDLTCYLSVVDMSHGMSMNMDEFGVNAYQTRSIESVPAGGEYRITIPVSVVYVGSFNFTATVIGGDGQAAISNAVPVNMLITSNMNKTFVVAVAAAMPLLLAVAAFILTRRRKAAHP